MRVNKLYLSILLISAIYFGSVIGLLIARNFIKPYNPVQYNTNISPISSGRVVYTNCLYIPAVSGDKGVITRFCLNVLPGNGRVFISLPPFFDKESSVGFVFSKDAACKIFPELCNKYSYLFYSNDVIYGEGLSGTAGFSLLILSFFEKKIYNQTRIKNYPVTGFMLPNGVIAPVAGIPQKTNASLEVSNHLVAPTSGKHIISAYTILDLMKIYFNRSFNTSFSVPGSYNSVMREITEDMCEGIQNKTVSELIAKGDYYSAASWCFRIKSKQKVNYTADQINRMIENMYSKVNQTICYTYECREIKYQVISRLNLAKALNGTRKYWRYYTAVGWYKFFEIANQIHRRDTCTQIKRDYLALKYLYPKLPNTTDCFKMREYLARIYASLITYRNETAFKDIQNLVGYYLNRNGFSITAYNYLEYAKDLYSEGDKDSAFYYLILALEYAV